jgi:signal transduction histidine kinase
MPEKIHILIAEDNPYDAELLVNELHRSELEFDWERVDTEAAYVARLNPGLHLILSDYQMPQFDGLRALELLKERSDLDIPLIIVSGTIGEEIAVAAMRKGAADYLLKDRIGRLGSAVRRALKEVDERHERKRLEARFIEAQKMEVVGQLAGGVAHDFNNVLAVIMGYSELMAHELGKENPLQKYAEEIRLAATRASGLTQQLLIFSRKQTVQAVAINLNEVVGSMEKMLRRLIDENVEMKVVYGEEIGQIKADAGYIWQVLMNLVVNARDAMPHGGKLTIETKTATLDDAAALAHPGMAPGDYVLLSVRDTGIGISEEVKAHLFEAFFTTKPKGKGTGLGLVTCQTIIRQSGGHIEIDSEVDKGTTFKIYFPRTGLSVPVEIISHQKTAPPHRGGTETLLVVEDDPSVRQLAQGVLQAQGYKVLSATNGQDALRVAREHKATPISMVITDVIMPRMGGKVMAEWLKIDYPDLKILFTSGYTENALAQAGVVNGTVEFLPKPYSTTSLTQKVRELLDATPVTADV